MQKLHLPQLQELGRMFRSEHLQRQRQRSDQSKMPAKGVVSGLSQKTWIRKSPEKRSEEM